MIAKTGIAPLAVAAVAIGFEIYPRSAVISRIAAPGEQYISYYSYFSIHNFWLGNSFPLITAVMTCVTAVLLLCTIFVRALPRWMTFASVIITTFLAYRAMRAQYYESMAACILAMLCIADALIIAPELWHRIRKQL